MGFFGGGWERGAAGEEQDDECSPSKNSSCRIANSTQAESSASGAIQMPRVGRRVRTGYTSFRRSGWSAITSCLLVKDSVLQLRSKWIWLDNIIEKLQWYSDDNAGFRHNYLFTFLTVEVGRWRGAYCVKVLIFPGPVHTPVTCIRQQLHTLVKWIPMVIACPWQMRVLSRA